MYCEELIAIQSSGSSKEVQAAVAQFWGEFAMLGS
jgi:hypothetical protein